VLPGLLFFSFFIFFSINNTEKIMYALHETNFSEQISESANLTSTLLAETTNLAKNTAFIIENIENLSKNDLHNLLIQTIKYRRFIFGSTIAFAPNAFNDKGKNFAPFVYKTSNGFKKVNLDFDYTSGKYDWYSIPKKIQKPYWTEPYLSVVLKDVKLISYSVPMYKNDKFIGVVTVDFALEPLNKILGRYFDYKTIQFAIISKKGVFISHPNPEKIYYKTLFDSSAIGISHKVLAKYQRSIIAGESGFHKLKDPISEKVVWGFYARIPTSDWRIIVYVNEEELNGPIKEVFLESLILFIIAVIVALLLFIMIVRKGVKPLMKLQDFSKQIRDGNYNTKIEINTNDEISDLADDLNIMAEQLAKREKELIEVNENLERKVEERTLELQNVKESTDKIIDNSPMPIAVTDRDTGVVVRANKAMAEYHKIDLEELYTTLTVDWFWDKSERIEVLSQAKEKGKVIGYEIEGKRIGNNEKRWVQVSIFPIKYLDKNTFIVEMNDITEIKEANIKINSQNLEISARNKYISDSINYAKRIQSSILPSEKYFEDLFPNYFLMFRPKDVVSGDFYWVSQVGNKKVVAAVDCTGHGVPGALMSMIGNTLLNEIVIFGGTTNPAEILNILNQRIIEELNKDVNQTTYDGMDIAICVIDDEKRILEYSGAYRPLSYFKDGNYYEVKGDRKSIGDVKKEKIKYSTKTIGLNESVIFYLYSDGYVDQHNSINKKFGSKQFKELLEKIYTSNLEEQKEILVGQLENHKGSEIQRDDVTILGIKPIVDSKNVSNEIIFNYSGEFSHSKIIELSEKIEKIMLDKFNKKIARTINFCGNELMQNINFYSEEKLISGIGQYSIEYEQSQNWIVLISKNISTPEKINKFIERIDKYNSLNKDELKVLYKEKLKSETHVGSKGGGIGVLQILRKTKNKINYIVNKKNDNLSLITLKIYVSLN
jgi:serine phosphatase RsbU (regulator of sigma subunit)/HAMP domain-containing protein